MDFRKTLKRPEIYYPLILIAIEIILFLTNYKPGAYLIGWDNIMPEFDLSLNFTRSIFSLWQEYRGLGVLDGLAHSANLMHTVYISLLSIIFPDSVLRFLYTHLTHIVGGISFFFLSRKLTKNDNAAFIGSLLYMFNLGIIQMYFAPLEVFTTHFAALPLLALLITNALEKADYKNLTYLFLGALFVSPQGFVPTVFIAFSILFFYMLLTSLLRTMNLKNVLLVALIIFCANAFWLVPYSFSAVRTGGDIKNSRINQFSSEEIFFRNKSFGDLDSVTGLKGFMIDTIELDPTTFSNTYFMEKWKTLSESPFFIIFHLIFLILMSLGILEMIIKRKPAGAPYALTLFTAFIFLANSTPLFSVVNETIRNSFPLIGEAFRFPFTKFITVVAFCFSILATLGIAYVLKKYKKYQKLIFSGLITILIVLSYPAFMGYFTSPYLRQNLPHEYLNLFSQMQTKNPNERVVLFPVQTFWNWQYRDWGQRGSGFSWYGMPQPIMERAFDPWSPYDEQFYNEISYATNTQNKELFDRVIRKYDVSYILLDQSILNTLSPKEINYDSLKKFLESQESVKKEKQFGDLILYKVNKTDGWVYELDTKKTKGIYPNYSFENEDSVYGITGNYVTDTKNPNVINLFPSLFSEKLQENLEFNVENKENEYVLTPKNELPHDLSSYILRIPSLLETEFLIPVDVNFSSGQLILTPIYPKITINGAGVEINDDPIIITPDQIEDPITAEFLETKQTVNLNTQNLEAYLINPAVNSIKFTDEFGNTEVKYLDTNTLDKDAFYAKLSNEKVNTLSISIPKIKSPTQSVNNVIEKRKYEIKKKISSLFSNPYSSTQAKEGFGYVDLSAVDGYSELTFYMPDLYHEADYILFAKTKYKSGLPMRFYVDNDVERKAEVEAVFSKDIKETTVVIPKSSNFFRGYGFHFTVKSVGKEYASSSIQGIELYPLPAGLIKGMQFIDNSTYENEATDNPKIDIVNQKINPALYIAQKSTPGKYLILSQAYDIGWQAYEIPESNSRLINGINTRFPFISGNKLENHILANNWANAWKTKNGGKTIIIFVPSYFQYLGLFITSTAFVILIILFLKHHHLHKKHHSGN